LPDGIRVALCDDHRVVRSGLRRLLEDEADIEVVGDVGTCSEAVALAATAHPDVFVMDLDLPDGSGIEASRRLIEVSPGTKVLVLSVHDDLGYLRRAFDSGAAGYLVKDAADVELVLALHIVASGQRYVHPSLGVALLSDRPGPPRGPGGELSEREVEVLRLLALGCTNTEIAHHLYVSVRTVETHRAHIQQKLNLHSRADLAAFARNAGLLADTA
jgi:two-component system, NarL family, response regulator NreC